MSFRCSGAPLQSPCRDPRRICCQPLHLSLSSSSLLIVVVQTAETGEPAGSIAQTTQEWNVVSRMQQRFFHLKFGEASVMPTLKDAQGYAKSVRRSSAKCRLI